MKISIKHYGKSWVHPSKLIHLIIESDGSTMTEDVTNLKGEVSKDLICELRNIADELEEQNQKIELKK